MMVLDLMKGLDLRQLERFQGVFWDRICIKGVGYRFVLGDRPVGLDEV